MESEPTWRRDREREKGCREVAFFVLGDKCGRALECFF